MARDTSTLRDILFDELDGLRNGTSDPTRAQAVAKLSAQIIGTAKVEMEFHKIQLRAEKDGKSLVLGSMDLGSRAAPAVENSRSRQIEHQDDQTPPREGQATQSEPRRST